MYMGRSRERAARHAPGQLEPGSVSGQVEMPLDLRDLLPQVLQADVNRVVVLLPLQVGERLDQPGE
jgi:hypothetical protein